MAHTETDRATLKLLAWLEAHKGGRGGETGGGGDEVMDTLSSSNAVFFPDLRGLRGSSCYDTERPYYCSTCKLWFGVYGYKMHMDERLVALPLDWPYSHRGKNPELDK